MSSVAVLFEFSIVYMLHGNMKMYQSNFNFSLILAKFLVLCE